MKITRQGPVDSEGNLLDSEGEVQEKYDPDKKLNIIHIFYWYNNLQGKLKQEFHPPGMYHGKPRIYVKESVEKLGDNDLISHLRVYYGKQLLAQMDLDTPEYSEWYFQALGDGQYHDTNDFRFSQIRAKVNYLLNEGGWKLYKIGENKRFRKPKKIKPKTRKPVNKSTKKVKKVIRKKILPKKRK
jgi:hypothetical protein